MTAEGVRVSRVEIVSNRIKALDGEIRKIEKRLTRLKMEAPASTREKKIQEATLSLLGNVLHDLRKQQKLLAQPKKDENEEVGQR